ncbi:hypothetical protein BOX15_Mlig021545g1 [Macrostomum lignano]|uniref:Invertebrate defensins family profile domain-containing protein n=1 Tax=Macrostomum lignano TaxID=282301 RepID=A0A267GXJ2_9PLAT|nr:hypothetical protein BOX15_Mlig021545g1 [Macrostomum lignano]
MAHCYVDQCSSTTLLIVAAIACAALVKSPVEGHSEMSAAVWGDLCDMRLAYQFQSQEACSRLNGCGRVGRDGICQRYRRLFRCYCS